MKGEEALGQKSEMAFGLWGVENKKSQFISLILGGTWTYAYIK
jgi:hypothetical protein